MPDPKTSWRAVAAMFALNGSLFGIWASRVPAAAERHDLAPGDLGLLLLLMAGGAIVAFPLAGRLADQIGAAIVTRCLGVGNLMALLAITAAPGPITLGAALFVFGATHGAMDVAMNTWASEVERHIGRPVMSSFHAMFSLGTGMGAASGFVAASLGFGITLHFIAAGLAVAALTQWLAWIDWTSSRRPQTKSVQIFALPKGPLFAVGFIAFCASLGEGGMADWSAIFLVLTTGANDAQAALGYTVFSIAMVAMRLMGDKVILTYGSKIAARMAGAFATTGSLCAIVFGNYAMSLLGFGLMGIGYAIIMPLAFSRAANDPDTSPGAAIASVSTLGYGGMLLGPPLIGFVAHLTSIRAAFLILTFLALLIVLLAGRVFRPTLARPLKREEVRHQI